MSSSQSLTSSDKKAFNFTGKKASVLLNTDDLKIEYTNPSEKYKILEYLVVNSDQKQNQHPHQPLSSNIFTSNAVSPFTIKSYSNLNLPHSGGGPSPGTFDNIQLQTTRQSTGQPISLSDLLNNQQLSSSAISKIQNIQQKQHSLNPNNHIDLYSDHSNNNVNLLSTNSHNKNLNNGITTTTATKIKMPICKTHNEPKMNSIVMVDEYCREQYKKWQDLCVKSCEIVNQIIPRVKINGLFWSQIVDKVLVSGSILSGTYDIKEGQIYIQWVNRIKNGYSLVESYAKRGRADKIQELEREYLEFCNECEKIMGLIRHTDLFKEELLIGQITKIIHEQIVSAEQINETSQQTQSFLNKSNTNLNRRKSFVETQENLKASVESYPKPIEDILRQYYDNRQKSMEKPHKDSILNNLEGDKFTATFQQNQNNSTLTNSKTFSHGNKTARQQSKLQQQQFQQQPFTFAMNSFRNQIYNQIPRTDIKQTKKIIYDVQDVSRDISDNELMLRVCHDVALRDEQNGMNLDAYDLMDKAYQASENVKQLKVKKKMLLNTLKQRRKSMDNIKKQITPNGTRPMSYIRAVL